MTSFRIEVRDRAPRSAESLVQRLREAGLREVGEVYESRLFFLEGELAPAELERDALLLLVDPVTEEALVTNSADANVGTPERAANALSDSGAVATIEILPRPGVMDPTAETVLAELRAEGCAVSAVRTGRRYRLAGVTPLAHAGPATAAVGSAQPTATGTPTADTKAAAQLRAIIARTLANDCIEEVHIGSAGLAPAPRPPQRPFELRHVALRGLSDAELLSLSRRAHLFLSLEELRAIQRHYAELGREPTDIELETLAQTWSEHCVHKTLKSAVVYRGAPFPSPAAAGGDERSAAASAAGSAGPAAGFIERRYENLLKETIARATQELIAAGRGPTCLSVFKDNAGIIAFDEELGIAFKVETHNHPSAIEPYGGAATGIGGCIRDVIGCGRGAKPIASTDVFCVAPGDWPQDELPKGILHPARVLRGVVKGVADYGNRMGIPTVNGAIFFEPRYLGNPLVFCGSVGLIPRGLVEKQVNPGDQIVLIGGRTGRDGIHGATFSSAELTDSHADEFSHAVQIGNAITEKRVMDAVLAARDAAEGCLFSAITDCGAGGLSSAIGEMGAECGAVVELERVPLKYAGLRYDEIWISEAQERMVLAVPPENLQRFLAVMRAEECKATVIGAFGAAGQPGPLPDGRGSGEARLIVRYNGVTVGEMSMAFLHEGLPRVVREASWQPDAPLEPTLASATSRDAPLAHLSAAQTELPLSPDALLAALAARLREPDVASKAWVIRQYDHEVQGGSVIKPLMGPGHGPSDGAVLRPRLGQPRGIALACGLAPRLSDVDPYWMAAAAIDEALRNVIAVGGDPRATAILDNFCWGRTDDPRMLGALVRTCQACYDFAVAYGVPFISGKDSLNNEFALERDDLERLVETLRRRMDTDGDEWRARLPLIEARLRATGRLAIPPTLLISALALVGDVRRCPGADLKPAAGAGVYYVGGLAPVGFAAAVALRVHHAVADAIAAGLVAACHDVSDGGWLTALAEMAIAGDCGVELDSPRPDERGAQHQEQRATGGISADWPAAHEFLAEAVAGYLVQPRDGAVIERWLSERGVEFQRVARVITDKRLRYQSAEIGIATLRAAWQ